MNILLMPHTRSACSHALYIGKVTMLRSLQAQLLYSQASHRLESRMGPPMGHSNNPRHHCRLCHSPDSILFLTSPVHGSDALPVHINHSTVLQDCEGSISISWKCRWNVCCSPHKLFFLACPIDWQHIVAGCPVHVVHLRGTKVCGWSSWVCQEQAWSIDFLTTFLPVFPGPIQWHSDVVGLP